MQLAAIGLFLAAAWVVSFVFGGVPGGVRVATALAGGVVAPVLASVAAVQLAGAALRLTRRRGSVVIGAATVAFGSLAACSLALGSLPSSSRPDHADAAGPAGLAGALTLAFAVTSVAAFAAVVALVLFAVLRVRGAAVRAAALVACGTALVAAPLLAWALLVPLPVALYCGAVLFAAVLPWVRGRAAAGLVRPVTAGAAAAEPAPLPGAETPAPRHPDPSVVRGRVILLAAVALAATPIVWVAGVGASLAATGTDTATVGLGIASAVAQLAVLPLLWAAALVVGARAPGAAVPPLPVVVGGVALVVAAVAAMAVGALPGGGTAAGGDPFVALVGVLGLGVGLVVGALVWPHTARWPATVRWAASAGSVVGAALLYAGFAGFTGGVTLVLASAYLAFGGARYLVRPDAPVTSPATPAAS